MWPGGFILEASAIGLPASFGLHVYIYVHINVYASSHACMCVYVTVVAREFEVLLLRCHPSILETGSVIGLKVLIRLASPSGLPRSS